MRKYGLKISDSNKNVRFEFPKFDFQIKIPKLTVDLRKIYNMPQIYDQGQLGSCTATSLSYAYHFLEIKQKNKFIIRPSPLFLYYNERAIEGTILFDDGAMIYSGITSLKKTGICDNSLWPYNISKFKIMPTSLCYTRAKLCKLLQSTNLQQNLITLKLALTNNNIFVFGFLVYDSFETNNVTNSGIVPMPKINNEQLLGGHAVVCIGYDDKKKTFEGKFGMFICVNSWGTSWGDKGFFYMPYDYLVNSDLAGDFWMLNKITSPISNPKIRHSTKVQTLIKKKRVLYTKNLLKPKINQSKIM